MAAGPYRRFTNGITLQKAIAQGGVTRGGRQHHHNPLPR
jgi:hypothetical protein